MNHSTQQDRDTLAAYAGALVKIGTPGAIQSAMDIHDWINKRYQTTAHQ